jgi:hypothetical protein
MPDKYIFALKINATGGRGGGENFLKLSFIIIEIFLLFFG